VVKSSNQNCYEFWSFPIFNFFAYLLKYIFLSLDNQKVRERCAEYESAEITARKVNGKEKRRISDKKGLNKIQIIKFSGMNKEIIFPKYHNKFLICQQQCDLYVQ